MTPRMTVIYIKEVTYDSICIKLQEKNKVLSNQSYCKTAMQENLNNSAINQ